MFFRLALKNVRKSYREYTIYFFTLAIAVSLFFTFNSLNEQQFVLDLNQSQKEIINVASQFVFYISLFIAILLGFLILYANQFLIKRRKKEFALYMLLGMEKRNITKVMIYETFVIGVVSLLIGIIIGVLLSQVLLVVSATLFMMKLNYQFIFSYDAFIRTILAFSIIYLVVMIFQSIIVNRYRLIQLMQANKVSERFRWITTRRSIVLFICAVASIAYSYSLSINRGLSAFNNFGLIVLFGSIGTLLLFASLAGFMVEFVSLSKKLYYRKLNMFILREVHASIKTNFISMSVVCILLLLSISTLAGSLSISKVANQGMELATVYDISFESYIIGDGDNSVKELITPTDLSNVKGIKRIDTISMYENGLNLLSEENYYTKIPVIKQSEFNQLRKHVGLDPIQLHEHETWIISASLTDEDRFNSIYKKNTVLENGDTKFTIVNDGIEMIGIRTTYRNGNTPVIAAIVNDEELDMSMLESKTLMTNIVIDETANAYEVTEAIRQKLDDSTTIRMEYMEKHNTNDSLAYIMETDLVSREEALANSQGTSVVTSFLGLYIGSILLLSSIVILALQQLSRAIDSKERYAMISKLGADRVSRNRTIAIQIAIYFILPLVFALIHLLVVMNVITLGVKEYMYIDLSAPIAFSVMSVLSIYILYYIITYVSYKRILNN